MFIQRRILVLLLDFYSLQLCLLINTVSRSFIRTIVPLMKKSCLALRVNNFFVRMLNTFKALFINATNFVKHISMYENIKILFCITKKIPLKY